MILALGLRKDVLGVEHHLLISPLGGHLSICRIKIGALGTGKGLGLLLLLLEKRRIKGRRSDVGGPAAMWLLLNRICKGLLLCCQQHLLLLLK